MIHPFKPTKNQIITFLYYFLFLTLAGSMILVQPLGEGPDETLRYLVAQFIAKHGTIPSGYNPEILISGYGGSYAFQPILSYIIMGFFMRFLSIFHASASILLISARCINLFFGLLMAWFVRRISLLIFQNADASWLFCFLITYLPENIFMHTYVNTDSMALLSISIIIYSWIRLLFSSPTYKQYFLLAIGLILCAMSYYNAYEYALVTIILFPFLFYKNKRFDWKSFFKYGLFVLVIVLLGTLWWFIRSYILYDGDILGLQARTAYAAATSDALHNPYTKSTFYNSGYSLYQMLFQSDFSIRIFNSFLAMFGPASISSSIWLYRFYKILLPFGILFSLLFFKNHKKIYYFRFLSNRRRHLFEFSLGFSAIIAFALGIYYSYALDYQPQGRYFLPLLIPLMYFVSVGVLKFREWLYNKFPNRKNLFRFLIPSIIAIIILFTILTFWGYVVPYYLGCYSAEQYDYMIHHLGMLPF